MVLIRKLEKSDSSQVALLIHQLTPRITEPEKLSERIEGLAKSGNSQYIVAKVNDKIVGFGGLAWYEIPSKGLVGWIEELVVDEKYRNQGIGTELMEELIELAEAKKIKQIKLTTANPSAKNLYQKFGFADKNESLLVKKYY